MTTALLSLALQKPVPTDLAMTGEVGERRLSEDTKERVRSP